MNNSTMCYFNSVIQCLVHSTPEFMADIKGCLQTQGHEILLSPPISTTLLQLDSMLRAEGGFTCDAISVFSAMASRNPSLVVGQHDVHELFMLFMDLVSCKSMLSPEALMTPVCGAVRGRARPGWAGLGTTERCGGGRARRCGAVRCVAVGAVRCGAMRCGAVRCGAR